MVVMGEAEVQVAAVAKASAAVVEGWEMVAVAMAAVMVVGSLAMAGAVVVKDWEVAGVAVTVEEKAEAPAAVAEAALGMAAVDEAVEDVTGIAVQCEGAGAACPSLSAAGSAGGSADEGMPRVDEM